MGAVGDRIVPALFQTVGFEVWHDPNEPSRFVSAARSRCRVARSGLIASRWVAFEGSVEVIGCQLDLVQVVFAAHRPGRFAGSLDRWQEQSDEDSDNGDHDQEFDEGKAQARVGSVKTVRWIGNRFHGCFLFGSVLKRLNDPAGGKLPRIGRFDVSL